MNEKRTNEKPQAPKHLRDATGRWFASVLAAFQLEAHHIRLLTLACEAWNRCTEARESIKENGLVFIDRFGSPKARPEVAIERDSRLAFARLLRELALDIDGPSEASERSPTIQPNAKARLSCHG